MTYIAPEVMEVGELHDKIFGNAAADCNSNGYKPGNGGCNSSGVGPS